MKKNNVNPSTFDKAISSMGFDQSEELDTIENLDSRILSDEDDVEPDVDESEVDEEEHLDVREDDSEIPDDVINDNKNSSNKQTTVENEDNANTVDTDTIDENEDDTVDESDQVVAFFDALAEANGWDVEDSEKPTTVTDLIKYMSDVIEENSVPTYSDPRVEQLDNYIRNGGNFDDFYNEISEELKYESLDMEDEQNQKAVIKEYLKLQGYSDDQVANKLERYEDADMLQDEANDAVEILKSIKQKQLEQEQQEQQLEYENQQKQIMEFSKNLNDQIFSLTNIRGINVPKEDRKQLFDYITKVDKNGYTQYQKDFSKNQIKNIIESAYFTMKGDALLTEAAKGGQTSAVKKLRQILKSSSKNHSSKGLGDETKISAVDIASKYFS